MTHENPEDEEDFYASGNVRDMRGHNGGPPLDEEEGPVVPNLAGLTLEQQLAVGRQVLIENLIRMVALGQASAQEMGVLAKLLKDNGMVMGDPFEAEQGGGSGGHKNVKADLPTFSRPEYVED